MRKALEWLGGSCLVYAALAACSGASNITPTAEVTGGAGMMASSGQPSTGGVLAEQPAAAGKASSSSGSGGMLDPIPSAMAAGSGGTPPAATPEPVVKTAPCDQVAKIGANNAPVAIVDLPGESAVSLSRARVTLNFAGTDPSAAEGFTGRVQDFYVKDGQIAVWCTNADESITVVF